MAYFKTFPNDPICRINVLRLKCELRIVPRRCPLKARFVNTKLETDWFFSPSFFF